MTNKKSGIKKWIALVVVALLVALAAMFMMNSNNNESSAMESLEGLEALPQEEMTEQPNTESMQNEAEKTLPVADELSVEERKDVMMSVLEAAKQDVAHAKEQLAAAKAAGDTAKAAEAQARLDNMRTVLKVALEKNADLEIDFPEGLFED